MKKIVVIGGGTGVSTILRGLKKHTSEIVGIVTMADDGGGSGMLRQDLGILPPGDVRNCLAALANTEPVMERLLEYRFESGTLKGQNFGNILIAALCGIYGSFDTALMEMENVLQITGKVIPVTLDNIHLVAEFETGDKCIGESVIPKMAQKLNTKIKKISLFPDGANANPKAIDSILKADLILLAPGSLYTSLIPNLIVRNVLESIQISKAKKIYISNIMTQVGETSDYTLRDHIKAIEDHSSKNIIDYCIVNNKNIREETLDSYFIGSKSKEIKVTKEDEEFFKNRNIKLIFGDVLNGDDRYIRHDGEKICNILKELEIL